MLDSFSLITSELPEVLSHAFSINFFTSKTKSYLASSFKKMFCIEKFPVNIRKMIYKNVRVKLQREDSYQCLLMVI
jgi:hypothetical protein